MSNKGPPEEDAGIQNLLDNMSWNDRFELSITAPNCVKPLGSTLLLTLLSDECVWGMKNINIPWLRIAKHQMPVTTR